MVSHSELGDANEGLSQNEGRSVNAAFCWIDKTQATETRPMYRVRRSGERQMIGGEDA
jgi:hypothetical protein